MDNSITKFTDTQYLIIKEIITAIDNLGGKSGIISPIASWGDTLSDEDVLEQLRDFNKPSREA